MVDRNLDLAWKLLVLLVLAVVALVVKFLQWAIPERAKIFIFHTRLRVREFMNEH